MQHHTRVAELTWRPLIALVRRAISRRLQQLAYLMPRHTTELPVIIIVVLILYGSVVFMITIIAMNSQRQRMIQKINVSHVIVVVAYLAHVYLNLKII